MRKKVAVRYCGGCMPMYDRFWFVDQLRREFPQLELTAYDPGQEYQGILMICACIVACVDYSGFPESLPRFAAATAEDLEEAAEFLRKLSEVP